MVFLQFIVNALKAGIRHDHREGTQYDSVCKDDNFDKDQFEDAKKVLRTKGELHECFLKMLWSDLGMEEEYEETNMYGKIIGLLRKFNIAYVSKREQNNDYLYGAMTPKILIVPEFQPQSLMAIASSPLYPHEKKTNGHGWTKKARIV